MRLPFQYFIAILFALTSPVLAQQQTLLLWPNGNPEPSKVVGPETDPTTDANRMYAGKPTTRVANISHPSMLVYLAGSKNNTGAAALVFPGGGFQHLSIDMEGTEVCSWLNSIGVNCAVVKYRVPEHGRFPDNVEDLEDVQQAMRIMRSHATEWHIDPHRIGVIGFSAGAELAVGLSTHADYQGANVPPSTVDARPDFQMVIYPGGLRDREGKIGDSVVPPHNLPPTFLLQAENDHLAHPESSLVYYLALVAAGIPAEIHIYAEGGHGFGLRPTELPISHWPALADTWLHTIHILGAPGSATRP
jgi:acetyl esterase/lipase